MEGTVLMVRKSVSGRVDDMFLMKSRLGNLPNLIRRVRFCSSFFSWYCGWYCGSHNETI